MLGAAPTYEEAVGKTTSAIHDFLSWLQKRGESVPSVSKEELQLEVVETLEAHISIKNADSEACTLWDREPMAQADLATMKRRLLYSRDDLLSTLESIPAEAMDWKPGQDSNRSARQHLMHIEFVDLFYAAWLFDSASKEGLKDFLGWTRRIALERLTRLSGEERTRMTYAHWSGAPSAEPWTARKTLRRILWHELIHHRAIRRLIDKFQAEK